MRLSLALSLVTVLLSTVVGCARNARPTTLDANDASWTPPGQVDVTIKSNVRETNIAKEQAEACRPNKSEIPQKGAVRAAVY